MMPRQRQQPHEAEHHHADHRQSYDHHQEPGRRDTQVVHAFPGELGIGIISNSHYDIALEGRIRKRRENIKMLLYIFIWWVDISKMPVDSDLNVGQKKYIQSVKV